MDVSTVEKQEAVFLIPDVRGATMSSHRPMEGM